MAQTSEAAPITDQAGAGTKRTSVILIVIASVLLALAQLTVGGYRLGVGNQSIQIPILKSEIDPTLFAKDVVLSTTKDYPTYFFRCLALLIAHTNLNWSYLVLHLLTATAVFAVVYALAAAVHPSRWAGPVAMLLLVAGHHQALAGDDLYATGFTHTWAVFPMAIAVLALIYRNRFVSAFALAGLIFNFHALTGAYLVVMGGAALVGEHNGKLWRNWKTMAAAGAVFLVLALPTLVLMLPHGQRWDATWMSRTNIRSADHVLASTWWQTGDPEIPQFAVILGLAAVAMSFRGRSDALRRSAGLAAGAGLLMAAGYVFVQMVPISLVIRAQLFRSSRLLLLLAIVQIACGLAAVLDAHKETKLSRTQKMGEIVSAIITFICLALPVFLPWLPVALGAAVLAALVSGRLAWWQAMVAGSALLLCLVAANRIDFAMGGLGALGHAAIAAIQWPPTAWLAIGAAVVVLGTSRSRFMPRLLTGFCALALATGVACAILPPLATVPRDSWTDAQVWARENTPQGSLFLTPIRPGGFRIYSDRPVVAEWRDGTQLFFAPEFGDIWWPRMAALQPGMVYDANGTSVLDAGRSVASLDDQQLIALARSYSADFIVLPAASTTQHELQSVYRNDQWAIYRPQFPPSEVPESANPSVWKAQQQFMRDVVAANIEKYRKGQLNVQLVDPLDRPIYNLPYHLRETRSRFDFSCSLPFFVDPPKKDYSGELYRPAPVTPMELDRFLDLFNSSLIPFSGKWVNIEQHEGQPKYDDLDAYVNWCVDHHIPMELHFLSGYSAPWLYAKSTAEQGRLYRAHALDLVKRYGDKIKFWQVTNEKILMRYVPDVIRAIRQIAPQAQLGISDCARFYSPIKAGPARQHDLLEGINELRWLKSQGTPVDFFSIHGHKPFGVWDSPQDIYEVLNAFAGEGVRVHVSEFGTPLQKGKPILGESRHGEWTAELQGEFYEQFHTVCFSHPAVDLVNLWLIGPDTWQPGAGLLDEKYNPKPAYVRLQNLIHHTLNSDITGMLDLDGLIATRAFYGDYDLTVTLPDGRAAHASLNHAEGSSEVFRFVVDTSAGTITRQR
jgi:GH35 family endo-1,4-beta-xylanase